MQWFVYDEIQSFSNIVLLFLYYSCPESMHNNIYDWGVSADRFFAKLSYSYSSWSIYDIKHPAACNQQWVKLRRHPRMMNFSCCTLGFPGKYYPMQESLIISRRCVFLLSTPLWWPVLLFPDIMPDDNPNKTSDTSGAMVITVIKALLYHRVDLRCTERPLDAPVKSRTQDEHYYYIAVCHFPIFRRLFHRFAQNP